MSANNPYQRLYDRAYFEGLHKLNLIGNNAYREAQRLETIEVLCSPDITDKVLELGCGTGFYTRLLSPRVYRVTGVDFSATAIEKAIAQGQGDNIQFVIGDIQNLNMFPDSAFDQLAPRARSAAVRQNARPLGRGGFTKYWRLMCWNICPILSYELHYGRLCVY